MDKTKTEDETRFKIDVLLNEIRDEEKLKIVYFMIVGLINK